MALGAPCDESVAHSLGVRYHASMNGDSIKEALSARKKAGAAGPRTVAELAAAVGANRTALHDALAGRRPMPVDVAAAIRRALPEVDHE